MAQSGKKEHLDASTGNTRFRSRPTAFFFAAATLRRHISTFRGYRILFSIRNPNINRFANHFSIHS
jgi:hypothetical protein